MLLVLKRIFSHPAFFIPFLMAVGAFDAATNPDFAQFLSSFVLKIWESKAASLIFDYSVYVLLFIAATALERSVWGWWNSGAADRVARRAERERQSREIGERVAAENRRRDELDYRVWTEAQINPWRALLTEVGEAGLVSEIEAMFADRKDGESQTLAERRHALEIAQWLVEKAVAFSGAHASAADPAANEVKIHRFVEEAFCIAGQHDGWRRIKGVPGAREVVAPVFRGQAPIYRSQCGSSQAFLDFALWLAVG